MRRTQDPRGVTMRVNSTGTVYGPRNQINLIPGTGVTISVADDTTDGELDVTINATGGGTHASPAGKFYWWAELNGSGGAVSSPASLNTSNSAGTLTTVLFSNVLYARRLSSSGVGNLTAGYQGPNTGIGTTYGALPDFECLMATGERAQDIANVRIIVGMGTLALTQIAAEPMNAGAGSYIGFRYSSYDHGNPSTWYVFGQQGGSFTARSVGSNVTANTVYKLRVRYTSATTVEFYINDVLVDTLNSGNGDTLPTASVQPTNYSAGLLSTTNDGNDHAIHFRWMTVISD